MTASVRITIVGLLFALPAAAWEQSIPGQSQTPKAQTDNNGPASNPSFPTETFVVARQALPGPVAQWPSVDKPLEIAAKDAPQLGQGEFSVAVWMKCDVEDRLPGDLISQYDPTSRRGFHLTLKSNPGVTSSQSNWRHLQFGIDDNRTTDWADCGRPGNALLAFALAVHDGSLYASTCEPGKTESGKVYRFHRPNQWIPCGSPDGANAVAALAVHDGALYAGTGKYRLAGSALTESENAIRGGRVFRYNGGNRWIACGQLPDTECVGGLVVFRGKLYASSLYKPAGFFRYEGGTQWSRLPVPSGLDLTTGKPGPKRVVSLTVHDGFLYAGSYDGGHVYRYDGEAWTDCGLIGDNTQTYSFAQYRGALHVGTWRSGRVYRFEGINKWADVGRLGEELEVMGMLVHNGRLIAGTLPRAEVYSFEKDGWQRMAQLDRTPNVTYRRAWTMAEYDGQVFCSTLPSGHIFAFAAGQQTTWGHTMPAGWHHVVAVKSKNRLQLFVDGTSVAQTSDFEAGSYNLDSSASLRLGTGENGPFNGLLKELRVWRRALSPAEIQEFASNPPQR